MKDSLIADISYSIKTTMSTIHPDKRTRADGHTATSTTIMDSTPGTQSLLLTRLPGELRNKIYRLVLVSPKEIELEGDGCKQPALLSVSRQVRRESITIYYNENVFRSVVQDLAGAPGEKLFAVMRSYRGERRNNFQKVIMKSRNWGNLLAWMKVRHELQACKETSTGTTRHGKVVLAASGIVWAMQAQPWTQVQEVLEAFHRAIVAENAEWA